MPGLRWILLGLGIMLLVGIWWWGARRSRQAPGDAQLRESTAAMTPPLHPAPPHADKAAAAESTDWGVPPFEPLNIRTADFDDLPHIDLSMTAHSEPFDDTLDLSQVAAPLPETGPKKSPAPPHLRPPAAPVPPRLASSRAAPAAVPVATVRATAAPAPPVSTLSPAPVAAPPPAAALDNGDRFNGAEAPEPNAGEKQRIVSVRVCALGEALWDGSELMAVLENLGLAHGRYHVFHRKHSDGRTLFCAASLVEPGTFDLATMPEQEFRGLTLFAVLPGPAEPLQTIDALISTAEDLAEALQGTVQIAKGVPLSAQSVATLREDVARFQASMS